MIFSIGFRFRGRHEPDASHPRFSHSVVFLRLCVSPRSLGAVTPLIRVSSIRAFRCMANDWKTCNCIKSFISPRAKRERTTGFSSSSSAKKRGRRSIMSSSSSSFRPLKMMCVLFLSSLSVSLATHEAFQLFLKRTRWEYSPSVCRSQTFAFGAQTERRFIRNHREKKHLFFTHSLFLKLCRSRCAFSSHAVYTSSCPCG